MSHLDAARNAKRQARGEVTVARGGRDVVASYGSVPGELAACLRHVGIAERTDLRVTEVAGTTSAVRSLALRHGGQALVVGGAAETAGCWWSRPTPDRLVIYAPRRIADRVERIVRADVAHHPGAAFCPQSRSVQLGIFGRRAAELLGRVGAYGPSGDPRDAAPASVAMLDRQAVTWLLEADDQAVASVAVDAVEGVLDSIERLGRPLSLANVGEDAIALWSVLARRRRGAPGASAHVLAGGSRWTR